MFCVGLHGRQEKLRTTRNGSCWKPLDFTVLEIESAHLDGKGSNSTDKTPLIKISLKRINNPSSFSDWSRQTRHQPPAGRRRQAVLALLQDAGTKRVFANDCSSSGSSCPALQSHQALVLAPQSPLIKNCFSANSLIKWLRLHNVGR